VSPALGDSEFLQRKLDLVIGLCKYGSKHLSGDEAIGLLEQFLAKRLLREIGDRSEDWTIREAWLLKTIAQLWKHKHTY
jgi:hypothetical protein